MISAETVTRRFGDRVAVENVSFEVARGEVFGLLGPNGAGKTTTLRMLGGLIPPTSGSVSIGGEAFTRASGARLRARIGFLTETPGLWEHLTVRDNLEVYASLFGVSRPSDAAGRVLRLFDLYDRRDDRAALLSKGMKQKLALARALVHEPDVVLLDEPTANLDPHTARTVRDLLVEIRGQGRAVIVSTHNLDEIERLADRVALISRTVIAIGVPATLRRELFGRRLRVRLVGTPSTDTLAAAARATGVRDVAIDGQDLTATLETPDDQVPRLIRALVDAGAEIREVFDEQATLEEVYLQLLRAPKSSALDHPITRSPDRPITR